MQQDQAGPLDAGERFQLDRLLLEDQRPEDRHDIGQQPSGDPVLVGVAAFAKCATDESQRLLGLLTAHDVEVAIGPVGELLSRHAVHLDRPVVDVDRLYVGNEGRHGQAEGDAATRQQRVALGEPLDDFRHRQTAMLCRLVGVGRLVAVAQPLSELAGGARDRGVEVARLVVHV